ncbi:putative helicase MOV-10 [Drosophila albomicans]|uniref:Helicase MOV-10 n=1 Tax=Drosophila albomicans TaxID=7291 RepID=A0A6P8WTE3_DROAB|nr:putative helicase MOV-10 [Drosophila albomicans]
MEKLPMYGLSKNWLKALESNFSDKSLKDAAPIFNSYLQKQHLSYDNFCAILKALLHIDDVSTMQSYAELTQFNVNVGKNKLQKFFIKFSATTVNSASRLSSCYDEVVLVSRKGLEESPLPRPLILALSMSGKHVSQITKVTPRRFYFQSGIDLLDEPFDVIFRSPRIPQRLMYHALEILENRPDIHRYIFAIPDSNSKKYSAPAPKSLPTLTLFNASIRNNAEQLQAVQQIVAGQNPQAPYVVFGPPGTGKTTTIVEAILQLYLKGNNRILVTAGSNSACDTIAERLCEYVSKVAHVRERENVMLRLLSYTRLRKAKKTMPPKLLACSNYRSRRHEGLRRIDLSQYGIVVATLCTVGVLNVVNNPKFTHIFIDEAAASIEPETLMGIVGNKIHPCHVIVSGDHKQLGPVIMCNRAASLGLDQSLMDRLMANKLYQVNASGDYDKTLQTRLRRNYRSHPEIVGIYNKLFYNGELIPLAPPAEVNRAANWSVLPSQGFPIIFQAAHGATEREEHSTSSFNKREADVLCWYVTSLLRDGLGNGIEVKQEDIGVVSPYLAQCKLLKKMLRQRKQTNVKIGSVERFQGDEKSIIIVSMVSSYASTQFLSNPRRVNVLLSRAKSLMILIGNPITLSDDKNFKFIIDQCKMKGNLLFLENLLKDDFSKRQEQEANDSDSDTSSCSSDLDYRMNHLSV